MRIYRLVEILQLVGKYPHETWNTHRRVWLERGNLTSLWPKRILARPRERGNSITYLSLLRSLTPMMLVTLMIASLQCRTGDEVVC